MGACGRAWSVVNGGPTPMYVYIHSTHCVRIHVAADAKGAAGRVTGTFLYVHINCSTRLLAWPMCSLCVRTEYKYVLVHYSDVGRATIPLDPAGDYVPDCSRYCTSNYMQQLLNSLAIIWGVGLA